MESTCPGCNGNKDKRAKECFQCRKTKCFKGYSPEEIIQMYLDGKNQRDIAEEIGCSLGPVQRILKENNVECRPSNVRSFIVPTIEDLLKEYYEGVSIEALGRKYKCDSKYISQLLKNAGVITKPTKRDRFVNQDGYVQIAISDDDSMVGMRNIAGYVQEHRLVMARHLSRPLERFETVHHINGNTEDNRIENLQLRKGNHGPGQSLGM